jgi:C1A family cysteine protease
MSGGIRVLRRLGARGRLGAAILLCALLALFGTEGIGAAGELKIAPLNPEYVRYLIDHQKALEAPVLAGGSSSSRVAGRIPAPLNLRHLEGVSVFASPKGASSDVPAATPLPASFDLRLEYDRLPPVRDQGEYGLSWAFAAYASLESFLLPKDGQDFSEWHLGYRAFRGDSGSGADGFDNASDPRWWKTAGQDDWAAVAVLARGAGPVFETAAPYPGDRAPYTPVGAVRYWVRDVLYLSPSFQFAWLDISDPMTAAAIRNVKTALVRYGAVSAGMFATEDMVSGGTNYDASTHAFFNAGTDNPNHGVAIVGWDDDYPRKNFASSPPGDGAWIVRNCWGASWGEGGYFYVSYYDRRVGGGLVYTAVSRPSGLRVYQYDPLGWVTSSGYGSDTAWFANRFRASGNHRLFAVGFYTGAANSEYEIRVYAGGLERNPTGGTLLSGPQTGTVETPGWHVIDLTFPAMLSEGQNFAVVVRLRTPGYNYPIPLETAESGYSDSARASSFESFVSRDGASWSDLTKEDENANVCLKAFARSDAPAQTGGGCAGLPLGGGSGLLLLSPLFFFLFSGIGRPRRP